MTGNDSGDAAEIRALIARQFASVSWTRDRPADWAAFADDFLPGASLVPAARPAAPKSVEAFVERMKRVAAENLDSLEETALGAEVRVFGNVAVAMAVCGMSENGAAPERGVEAILLVKDAGRWRIAGQAWDMEARDKAVPPTWLDGG
ncbi:MAG: nuclear transport factor 2 family protein [Pseudomonadota bacterium]